MATPAKFEPKHHECATHGQYQANVLGPDDVVRWLPSCPLCVRDRATQALLGRAAVPPRFRDRTFESFRPADEKQQRALDIAESYAEGFREMFLPQGISLMFCGHPGTGKTHLACAVLNRIVPEGLYGLYVTVPDALRRVKDTWGRASTELEREVIQKFVRPDLLVLDEVGVQFGSEAEKLILFEIINGRYERVKPTLVVSNLDRAGVTANLGDRCVDRLREGGGQFVAFDWGSHRGQA